MGLPCYEMVCGCVDGSGEGAGGLKGEAEGCEDVVGELHFVWLFDS